MGTWHVRGVDVGRLCWSGKQRDSRHKRVFCVGVSRGFSRAWACIYTPVGYASRMICERTFRQTRPPLMQPGGDKHTKTAGARKTKKKNLRRVKLLTRSLCGADSSIHMHMLFGNC